MMKKVHYTFGINNWWQKKKRNREKEKTLYLSTVGLGAKADFASNLYYKVEGTHTNYDGYSDTSTSLNKVEADTEINSLKVSIGYKF